MKTYEKLMQHYWGVIVPMANASGIEPWVCVRYNGEQATTQSHPHLKQIDGEYTFAITVLEGKPVFIGDKLYYKDTEFIVADCSEKQSFSNCTWTPPPPTKKRTFMLNGQEYGSPINDVNGCRLDFLGVDYYFETFRERNNIASAINNILQNARDK